MGHWGYQSGNRKDGDSAARGAAKDMPAVKALTVAEVFLVHDLAQLASSDRTGRGSKQTTQQCACQAADSHADWSAYSSKGGSYFGSRHRTGSPAGCSSDAANGAAGLAAHAARDDVVGITNRTNGHQVLLAMDAKKPGARCCAPGEWGGGQTNSGQSDVSCRCGSGYMCNQRRFKCASW